MTDPNLPPAVREALDADVRLPEGYVMTVPQWVLADRARFGALLLRWVNATNDFYLNEEERLESIIAALEKEANRE